MTMITTALQAAQHILNPLKRDPNNLVRRRRDSVEKVTTIDTLLIEADKIGAEVREVGKHLIIGKKGMPVTRPLPLPSAPSAV